MPENVNIDSSDHAQAELYEKIAAENITLQKETTDSLQSEAETIANRVGENSQLPSAENKTEQTDSVKASDTNTSSANADSTQSLIAVTDNTTFEPQVTVQTAIENVSTGEMTSTAEVSPNQAQTNKTQDNSVSVPVPQRQTFNSKTDDLNVLIQGLETLNNQLVTNNNPNLGQYRKVLSSIISPESTDSSKVPENEELKTNSSFNQLSSLKNNQDLKNKFVLISDVRRYINHIYSVLKGYQAEAESLKEGKSKSSHIEGMSSIISDMTYGKNSDNSADDTPSITDAISKLPSFNENGEIVHSNGTQSLKNLSAPASSTENLHSKENLVSASVLNSVQSGNEVHKSAAPTSGDINTSTNNHVTDISSKTDQQSLKTSHDDFAKAVEELSSGKENEIAQLNQNEANEQILTPQVAELTPDELLRKAQEEALQQLQSDQVLNQKLKEEALTLNKNVDASQFPKDSAAGEFSAEDKASLNAQLSDAVDVSQLRSFNQGENSVATPSENSAVLQGNQSLSVNQKDSVVLSTADDHHCEQINNCCSDTDFNNIQSFIPLSKAVAFELQKSSYSDAVPVIKSHSYSKSLETAILETLSGNLGQNHNVTERADTSSLNNDNVQASVNDSSSENRTSTVSASAQNQSEQLQYNPVQTVPLQSNTESFTNQQNLIFNQGQNQNTTPQGPSSNTRMPPELTDEIPVDVYEADIDAVDNSISDENADAEEYSESLKVTGNDLKFDKLSSDENSTNSDGNPKKFRESTLKLIEEDQQFENKRLGRRLESCDFYDRVYASDSWYQDIVKAGYNDGPVYSALCYTNRIINPDNPYSWTLQISSDFQLLFISPEFHHNLRTKFSIEQGHPVELKIEKVQGIPAGCPEDLARRCYVKEIEDTRRKMAKNKNISLLLEHLGEDIRTLNLSLYKQEDSKTVAKK